MRRRGSIVGPLIILGIGVLFLLKNFRPEIPVWDLLSKYWPVLLILLGLAKLVQAMSPPQEGVAPRPIISAGEVFLIILLCMFGSFIYWASRWGPDIAVRGPFGDIFAETFNYSQEAKLAVSEKQPTISILNPNGEVHVIGSDIAAIEVKAEKHVRARNESDAKRMEDEAKVEITKEGSGYVLRSNTDRASGRGRVTASLEVRVPKGASVDVQGRGGDVNLSELAGAVTVNVERGDVVLSDIGGKVRVDLRRGSFSAQRVKGPIEMDGRGSDIQVSDVDGEVIIRGEYSGSIGFANVKKVMHLTTSRTDLQIQKLPGKVDMTIGSLTITDSSGPISLSTKAKDIRIEEFDGPLQVVNRDATVELTTRKVPFQSIEVENKSGRIELSVPGNSQFQIEATARRGDVNSDFSEISAEHHTDQGVMKGSVGKNGPTVKLNTTYGTISLRKQG